MKFVIDDEKDLIRLDKYLTSNTDISRSKISEMIKEGLVLVNGKKTKSSYILRLNDNIEITGTLKIETNAKAEDIPLDIVYEDNNILVINKPINLEVVGENSLTTLVHQKYPKQKPMPCHRLDRNTTGLVLFAKNDTALNILFDKFKKHEIKKSYTALVYGIPKIKNSRLEAYLFKDNKKSLVYISDDFNPGYQKIITSYSVIKEFNNNTSLLEVNIETGRTHQIRAHLAHIGYPIIGDGKYGINQINKQFGYKYQQLNSFKLEFNFVTDAGILNYLNGTVITQKALHLI